MLLITTQLHYFVFIEQSSVPCAHLQLLLHAKAVAAAEPAQLLHLRLAPASWPPYDELHSRQLSAEGNQQAGHMPAAGCCDVLYHLWMHTAQTTEQAVSGTLSLQ
jgi:hypothetical protein